MSIIDQAKAIAAGELSDSRRIEQRMEAIAGELALLNERRATAQAPVDEAQARRSELWVARDVRGQDVSRELAALQHEVAESLEALEAIDRDREQLREHRATLSRYVIEARLAEVSAELEELLPQGEQLAQHAFETMCELLAANRDFAAWRRQVDVAYRARENAQQALGLNLPSGGAGVHRAIPRDSRMSDLLTGTAREVGRYEAVLAELRRAG